MFQNQSNNIQNNQINNMPNNQPIAKPTVQTEFNNTNTSNNQPVKLKRFKYKVKDIDGKIIDWSKLSQEELLAMKAKFKEREQELLKKINKELDGDDER